MLGGSRRSRTSVGEQLARSAASSIGREVGRQIIRGIKTLAPNAFVTELT